MNIYEERDYLLDVIKQLQRDSRHLEDGLIDARRVIWDYRKIEQNATSTLDELVESLDSMESERDQARRRIAELEATVANLDPRIARLERITPLAPIQGVEDMWFIGCESWQTEDE